jgi:hypothetical protein
MLDVRMNGETHVFEVSNVRSTSDTHVRIAAASSGMDGSEWRLLLLCLRQPTRRS